jgi:hypothetical protein
MSNEFYKGVAVAAPLALLRAERSKHKGPAIAGPLCLYKYVFNYCSLTRVGVSFPLMMVAALLAIASVTRARLSMSSVFTSSEGLW